VIRPAMETVQRLLDQLLAPLGGLDGRTTARFVRDLTTLLGTPLDA
jgi:hypothetical protein